MKQTEINPWEEILPSSKKRCISGPDIFWHVDEYGLYCLRFENIEISSVNFLNIELNEINIVINDSGSGLSTIILKLLEPKKFELFYYLSSDLINHLSNQTPISSLKLKNRLQFWIDLWKKKNKGEMSFIAQMSLYSELYVLFEYITPKKGIEFAVLSWRGPEKDKQDFDLVESLLEVKSYLSTSNKVLKISSAEQLTTRSQPIKLAAIQLSQDSDNGQSIHDLLSIHSNLIDNLPVEINGLLFSKLFELGYVDGDSASVKFNVISNNFFSVTEGFPVISSIGLSRGITSVEYSINIDYLGEFEFDPKNLIS